MPLPRIAPEELERLKREISLQRLVESRGIKLKPHGKDLIGLCPFHEDHSPSLIVSPFKNLWNCLGACGTGGTVIDWVIKTEGVSFRHAVEILREGAFPQGPITGKVIKKNTVPKLPTPVSADAEGRELMKQVIDYYHETLKKSPEGLSYLEKRGLKNSEMIDHFKIGYSNRTLGLRLPESNRIEGAAIRRKLAELGLYRGTGREHFCGSITFPIFDESGTVTEIYGRKTCHNLTPGLAYHLYLPGPHKGVFNVEALKVSKEIILCEAIIDALTFWCAGFRNVTASYGVNGFTPDLLAAFKKSGVERVYIAYDRDQAGDVAAKKLAETLVAEGFECFRVLFPHKMDANDYALKLKPPEKSLELVIRNAIWMGKGKRNVSETSKEESREETPSQPSEKPEDIFHLAAEKSPEPSPTPAQKPPRPEPARVEAVRFSDIPAEVRGEEILIQLDERRWRIRGLSKNLSYDQLKVNVLVSQGERFHVDTFDLYSARCRAVFIKQTCEELRLKEEFVKLELGRVLLKLEELQDKQIKAALEPKEKVVVLTPEERKEALELLQSPDLFPRVLSDFERCGIVGEETNKLVGYLAAVSRKLENPLAVIIQSSSAAGKTSLMEAVLAFMPEEERVKYSAMTGQSLFYMGETSLKHKILAIVEEEGAERASYAIKLLQSEGELTIASTGKDPSTGRLITHEYRVEGPVMIFITTTNADIDEELQNRCVMLSVDESREQTRAIHFVQREKRTLAGLRAKNDRAAIFKLHRNAQRLLKPIRVVNHYAHHLTFLDDKTRLRRDHDKYLNLIDTITLIHQHQRPVKTDIEGGRQTFYLEVILQDIELANKLADEVLGRTLDEMPPQTRKLLLMIEKMVIDGCQRLKQERFEYRFTRRDVREYTGWGNTQLKLHLQRLEEFEYLIPHRGCRGQNYVYELIYDGKGKDGKPFISGLIDVEKLRGKYAYVPEKSGVNDEKSGPSRPQVGLKSGPSRDEKIPGNEPTEIVSGKNPENSEKNTDTGMVEESTSYSHLRHNPILPLAAKKEKGNGSEKLLQEQS